MSYDSHGQYHALFHELGHIHHENKIGSRRLNKMYTGFDTELLKTSSSPYVMESTNRFASKQKNHLMASYLSQYALTCPGEYIAEMYAGTLDGNSYCKELKKMYRRYHGPNIPLFTKLRNFIMTKIN